uniref:Ribosomal protein S21e n=1 Tax=Lotharella vacuolata TaxID=74820 RepID=A0A0H5BGS7_9EUKA|nr:ribosomal protein S21e [Lotharella vacuolata]
MYNENGEYLDKYYPLYCSWSKKLIPLNEKYYIYTSLRLILKNGIPSKNIIFIAISSNIRSQVLKFPIDNILKKY